MNELTANLSGLRIGQRIHLGFSDEIPTEVPICPSGHLATKLNNTPRFLFRVYSDESAGDNSTEWMKSPAALENNLTDVFARDDAANIAIVLNEHLRWWPKSCGDPFISWTTSLLLAIQYAIYKHKKENAELEKIHLCIVDTTLFPKGVFIRDLDLIEEFHDKVPSGQLITYKDECHAWERRGLDDFHYLRNKRHKNYSGAYYFGEFLSQGQTNIKSRSFTVTCEKIVNEDLFAMFPQFKVELERHGSRWAEAVIECREPFYKDIVPAATSASEFCKAMNIALQFDTMWFLPMLANLLALRPRTAQDPGILGRISNLFKDELRLGLSSKDTKVVADEKIPEVLQFGKIIHDINEDYYLESVHDLLKSMKKTADIVRRFASNNRTTRALKLRGEGNPAYFLHRMDREHLQPLMQSLAVLSGIIKELQEDKTSV